MTAHVVSLHTGCRREGERKSWVWLLFPLVLICKHQGSFSPQGLVQFFWERLLVEWLCIKHVTSPLSSDCRALPDWLHCGYFPAVCGHRWLAFYQGHFSTPSVPGAETGESWGERQPPGEGWQGEELPQAWAPQLRFASHSKCFPENSVVKLSL